MPQVRIFPPLAGVSEDGSFSDQEAMTARDAENVVSMEPATGRTRLSKRPGLKRYVSSAIGTGKVRALAQVVHNNATIDWAATASGSTDLVWQTTPATPLGAQSLAVSPRGDIFWLDRTTSRTVSRVNADGAIITKVALEFDDSASTLQVNALCVDDADNFFVGASESYSTGSDYIRIMRYALQPDGTYRKAWELRSESEPPHNVNTGVARLVWKNGVLYTLQTDPAGGVDILLRTYKNVDGYATPTLDLDVTVYAGAAGCRGTGLAVDEAGNIFVTWFTTTPDQFLRKMNAAGGTVWTYQSTVSTRGGVGNAVAVQNGYIWTLGYQYTADTRWLAQYTDGATAPTFNWAATVNGASAGQVNYRQIIPDSFNNIHVVFPNTIAGAWNEYQMYDVSGNLDYYISSAVPFNSIGVPPTNPDYAASTTTPARPEYVYLSGVSSDYYKYRLAAPTAFGGSPRQFTLIAAVDDDIKVVTSSTVAAPTTGGTDILEAGTYVQMVTAFQKVWITDSSSYWVYDPVEDSVERYVSTTSGLIPPKCQLIESWRGRICLAGDPDNRHAIYWSAVGEPTNWDFYPPTPSSKQAVWTGLAAQLGDIPDLINCLFAYSNDWLLVGCDHSIWLVRGDPAAGGTIDLITNQVGMAWGRPCCFGPSGELYFFSNEGGVYVMGQGLGEPVRLTEARLERELQDINLGTYYPQLVYDNRQQGLLVCLVPFGASSSSHRAYFWSRKHQAWWPLRFGTTVITGYQPSAIIVHDADAPADRLIIFGCEDSYLRRLDEAVGYDESTAGARTAIGSYVLVGPFNAEDRIRRMKVRSLFATLAGASGLDYQVFVKARPDADLVDPVMAGHLPPGFSARKALHTQGMHTWIKLLDNSEGPTWAIESLALDVLYGGREPRAL